jgi:hypothetical protein
MSGHSIDVGGIRLMERTVLSRQTRGQCGETFRWDLSTAGMAGVIPREHEEETAVGNRAEAERQLPKPRVCILRTNLKEQPPDIAVVVLLGCIGPGTGRHEFNGSG